MYITKEKLNEMFTWKMGGKMSGMKGLTESCKACTNCQKRIENSIAEIRNYSPAAAAVIDRYLLPGDNKQHITGKKAAELLTEMGCKVCICIFCYADNALSFQHSAEKKFSENTSIMETELNEFEPNSLNPEMFPIISGNHVCRYNAQGDTNSFIGAANFNRICKANPEILFTVWTKNPLHFVKAFEMEGKAKNLQLVLSGYYINDFQSNIDMYKLYPGVFDRMFVVVTEKFARENGIIPNCCRLGDHNKTQCLRDCGACYSRTGKETIVSENGSIVDNGIMRIELLR